MHNIVDVLGLRPVLERANIGYNGENFESLYSRLVLDEQHASTVKALESAIFQYFASMELPDEPTLYDHLVLSLREKDCIATFNWDPFLVQAFARNYVQSGGPTLLFLHGNTAIGCCFRHRRPSVGHRDARCGQCGSPFSPSKLLYPVAQKNYSQDPLIKMSWDELRSQLKAAFVLTFFGYGAPASDVEAVQLMKDAWGSVEERQYEETEIIDIKSEEELVRTWDPFIHTHHYRTQSSFYESILFRHPRRSCEAMWSQIMDAEFIDQNPLPAGAGWPELRRFFEVLTEDEKGVR